ncbi:MAG: 3-hydroxyacyl-CoA dehydrogenase family protein, partial [Cyclobacteriaceae bacterium]|nr:3-hydroxyacyl-CoA dehydrogenase family protein [Cyclobacteriaceae bacterium]
ADLARYFISRYISYSLSIVGEVVETKEMVDQAMGFGFNWAPASSFVDFLGGVKETIKLLEQSKIPVPKILSDANPKEQFYRLDQVLDPRSLFKA